MSTSNNKLVFSNWLEGKFLQWMNESNQRHTVTEFAQYLCVPRQKLSRWLKGNLLPSGNNIHLIASKLGIEVYRFIEVDHPDEKLKEMIINWYDLDVDSRNSIFFHYKDLREENFSSNKD